MRKRKKRAVQTPVMQFKVWKDTLCKIVKQKSKLVYSADKASHSFVLPTEIVRLVWQTTIQERAKVDQIEETEALAKIKQEVSAEADKLNGKTEDSDSETTTEDGPTEEVSEVVAEELAAELAAE